MSRTGRKWHILNAYKNCGIRSSLLALCLLAVADDAYGGTAHKPLSPGEFFQQRPAGFYKLTFEASDICRPLYNSLNSSYAPDLAPHYEQCPRVEQLSVLGNSFLVGPWRMRDIETGNPPGSGRPATLFWEEVSADIDNDGPSDTVYRSFSMVSGITIENLAVSSDPTFPKYATIPHAKAQNILGPTEFGDLVSQHSVSISKRTVKPAAAQFEKYERYYLDLIQVKGRYYIMAAPAIFADRHFSVLVLQYRNPRKLRLLCAFQNRLVVSGNE